MTSAAVYLIRHAQSRPSSRIAEPKWPLSVVGSQQAERLARLLEPLRIARLYSSPYVRCLNTIQPFASRVGLDIVVKDDLRERNLANGVRIDFQEVWDRSWADFAFALPECESSFQAQNRFVRAVREITQDRSGPIGICGHGNVMALLLNHLEPTYGREDADRLRNPDVVKLVVEEAGLRWDSEFNLPGLDDVATHARETPVDW